MAIYRGPGGAGDATNDATSQAILAAQSAQEAAASEAAAATSASNASTSATNAASSATAAANSATSAANSASTATTQAANAASSAATATTKASEAATSATNAASSASAAATSATNAASSATAAANSATSASNSASAASTSASNAGTYASNAATSATNAAASATSATSSANSASNSATSAAASSTSAGNSASSATTSATNAASSASAAAASATNAATSATSASNSATSAGTSATNAANSASSASTSATNAASSASGAASSASSAAASAAAAAASLDSFDDRYLGSKTADPTLDNDGNALVTGALYYNSVEGEMRVYDGFQWIAASAASQAILVVYKYTATAGQTTFTGTDDNALTLAYTVGSIIVTVNGVVQEVGTEVTASTGTSIVLSVAASAGDEVNIHAFSTFDVANTYTKAEADAKYLTITSPTIPSGTANGVAYLNGSKVLTTGSALTFDGTNLGIGITGGSERLSVRNDSLSSTTVGANTIGAFRSYGSGADANIAFTDSVAYSAKIGQVGGAFYVYTGGSERMRIDSSGNLGLGVTPSAWHSTGKALETGAGSFYGYSTTSLHIIQNAYYDGSWKYKNTAAASYYRQIGGQHEWYAAPSGTAGNVISFTQAMTLDASGNLLVNRTSVVGSEKISVNGGARFETFADLIGGAGTPELRLYQNSGNWSVRNSAGALAFYSLSASAERMRIDSSGNVGIGTSSPNAKLTLSGTNTSIRINDNAQSWFWITAQNSANMLSIGGTGATVPASGALNIDSSGRLLVGTTSVPTGAAYGWCLTSDSQVLSSRATASATTHYAFLNTNGQVGRIETSGSSTSYVTSSDYRLKENIQPMQNALGVVAQLNPVTYTWKADGSDGQGFIAHELQAVVPDAVTGEKDAVDEEGNPVYQGIDTSFLVATLTKAIQEQQEQINQLKAEVAALKGN